MNSRDRLVMDLERPALTLMLQLLSSDSSGGSQDKGRESPSCQPGEVEKTRGKVGAILETFRKEGNVKDFVLEEISVSVHVLCSYLQ